MVFHFYFSVFICHRYVWLLSLWLYCCWPEDFVCMGLDNIVISVPEFKIIKIHDYFGFLNNILCYIISSNKSRCTESLQFSLWRRILKLAPCDVGGLVSSVGLTRHCLHSKSKIESYFSVLADKVVNITRASLWKWTKSNQVLFTYYMLLWKCGLIINCFSVWLPFVCSSTGRHNLWAYFINCERSGGVQSNSEGC